MIYSSKIYQRISVILIIIITLSTITSFIVNTVNAQQEKIYVAIIWHYHQPWYYSPDETYFILPWVRMHSVGNYYKMAYILSKYPSIRVTFTFSGSLLEQIVDYVENNKMDIREIISLRIVNGSISRDDVYDMLKIPGGFFDINWARFVENSPRYRELRDLSQSLQKDCALKSKSENEYKNCIIDGFTQGNLLHQNVVDLAVLFNLLWIDPEVARENYPDIYELMVKAYNSTKPSYSISDLVKILGVHREIMKKVLTTYRELASRNQIELIPVPYSHPLAPLLVDANLSSDLETHVRLGVDLFKKYFGITPKGIWPAEQAVNEYVVHAFKKAGINWTVTDSTILSAAGINAKDVNNLGVPWYIDFPEGRIYVFFRETELSNLISFQYSTWDQDQAVNDFISRILQYRSSARGPRIVVIALDGENPWENYPDFGCVFLNKLYSKLSELQKQGVLETITPWDFISRFASEARSLPLRQYSYLDLVQKDIADLPSDSYGDAYSDLPRKNVTARLPEGSWGGGEIAIWIGDRQENVAFMWMIKARDEIMRKLGVEDLIELYNKYPDVAKYLLKAQASDWWWWYGGDGGGSPAPFDPLFKAYLIKAYELAGLEPPNYLKVTAYPDGRPIGTLNSIAPSLIDKELKMDGVIENTWYELLNQGKALNVVVGDVLSNAFVALDSNTLYFAFSIGEVNLSGLKIAIYFATPRVNMTPYNPGYNIYPRNARVDLGIHLAREILIDPLSRTATISKADGKGNWIVMKTITDVYSSTTSNASYVEVGIKIVDLDLAPGDAYFAIALYRNEQLIEWSTRLGSAYLLFIPTPPIEVQGNVVLDMEDPVGDDDGAGGYTYPTNPVFKPGVFDLVRFTLIDAQDKLIFKFQFRTLGGNPWGGPNGWSLQQIHVYVKTTLPETGKLEAIGLNIVIEHGWHMALLVAPGWGTDPLPKGERTALYYYDKEQPVVQNGFLKAYADQATNSIIVEASKSIFYDVENIEKWTFVVAVTSHDGYGENKIRPFLVGGGEWQVGVPSGYALAVLNHVIPYVLDLLAPTKDEQYRMLQSFDPSKKELARVSGITVSKPTPTSTTTIPTTPYTTMPTVTTPSSTTTPRTTPTTTSPISTAPATEPSINTGLIIGITVVFVAIVVAIVALVKKTRR
ncbi:MAG: glucodextranase DOMON-like domain-containing protein [Desulfurococcaceae archaeon]